MDELYLSEVSDIDCICPQLYLAMAALCLQMPTEVWGEGGVLQWLGQELGSQPEGIHVLVELVLVLFQVTLTPSTYPVPLNDE